jgi:hypothetical protein
MNLKRRKNGNFKLERRKNGNFKLGVLSFSVLILEKCFRSDKYLTSFTVDARRNDPHMR